jgi:capsular exopolysaccharide synthesis family protein
VARVQSYVNVASGPSVTDFVVNQLKLPISSRALSHEITADAPLNKVIMNIHVTDESSARAAAIANAVAFRLGTVVQALESAKSGNRGSPVSLSVTKPAVPPGSATQPRPSLNLGLALLVGLILGVAGARLRDQYDDRVRSLEELEGAIRCPVLATLPRDPLSLRRRRSEPFERDWLPRRAFAQLQASLPYLDLDNPPRSICITSASRGEGKTYVALNLAFALARSGQPVCLLEANLRFPSIFALLKLPRKVGLTSMLTGHEQVERVAQPVREGLSVIAAGPVPPNPGAVFGSEHARLAISRTEDAFGYTVLDTAPLVTVQDAQVCTLASATILVIRRGRTRRRDLARVLEGLSQVGVRPAGAVLTMERRRIVLKRVRDAIEPPQAKGAAVAATSMTRAQA